jgi:hypothetical protein
LRQLKLSGALQFPQSPEATAFLRVTQGIEESKVLAHPLGNARARSIPIVLQYLLDDDNRFRL